MFWFGEDLYSKKVAAEVVNCPLKNEVNHSTIFILYRHEHTAYGQCIYSKYFPDTWLNGQYTHTQLFGEGEFEEGVPYKYLKGGEYSKSNCALKHEEISWALSPRAFHFHYTSRNSAAD